MFKGNNFSASLSIVVFELLCCDLLGRTMDAVRMALSDAKRIEDDIDEIVLVGG